MGELHRRFDRLAEGLALVAGLFIVVMSLLSSFEVVMRYFLNSPTSWSGELSQYLMLTMAWLSAPAALFRGNHIAVDFVVDRVREDRRRLFHTLGALAGLFYCVVLFAETLPLHRQAVQFSFRTSGNLAIPMSWPYSVILGGSVLLAVSFAWTGFRLWAPSLRSDRPAARDLAKGA